MGDWLGTGTIATRSRQYQSFRKARTFARNLHLKTTDEWIDYCKSGKKPADIPFRPSKVYRGAGWAGFGDWLGTGNIATFRRKYLSFEKARAFARSLGLKSQKEWFDYCRSGRMRSDIPHAPHLVYRNWVRWGDWLGYAHHIPDWPLEHCHPGLPSIASINRIARHSRRSGAARAQLAHVAERHRRAGGGVAVL